jgi:tRNA threonylcarbamoyladenosine biosynthesis protein TsaB
MIVLGIEGALGEFSAAVAIDGTIVAQTARGGNVALESGLTVIDETLRAAKVRASSLERIAVGNGPGGFTGLRITVAYAKSLAQAWRLPLVAVSSFDTLELGTELARCLCIVTGRPGVISARFRDGDTVARASGPIAEVLGAVLPAPDKRPLAVIGASEGVLAALAEARFIVEARTPLVTPAAAAVALAGARAHPSASAHEVRADYGEAPAAKIPSLTKATPRR